MGSFDNDLLGRKKYAEFLLTLIQNYERYKRNNESQSFVMAIDSPWGTGKSHFVNMFESYLNEQNEGNSYTVIRYNAWESDFWDNAFDPLMYAMLKDNRVNDGVGSKDFWEELKECIYAVGKGIALQPLLLVAGENAANQIEEIFDIENFDIENIVFMFALDIQQLGSSIKAVYGSEMDSVGYLTRFFDYISKIPEGETSKYAEILCQRHLSEYIEAKKLHEIINCFKELTNKCLLSLRDMETIYTNFILLVDYNLKEQPIDVYRFYSWAILIKYKEPFAFSQLINGRLNSRITDSPVIINTVPIPNPAKLMDTMGQKIVNIKIITEPLNLTRIKQNSLSWANLKVVEITGDKIRYGTAYNDSQDAYYTAPIRGNNINNIITDEDIARWDEISHLTLGHYLQRKLEFFDFKYISADETNVELETAPH